MASALLGGLGCALTLWLIPELESLLVEARLYGIDLNKPTTLRNAKGALRHTSPTTKRAPPTRARG